ncbi:MAG: NUDIX hydrolase [Candidatus Nanoarchaeia archaeon]
MVFDSFRARVGVVLMQGRNILLLRDSRQSPPTFFLPGGVVRLGETLETAAKREVKSQTGVDIELQKILYIYDNIKDENKHRLDIFFLAKIVAEQIATPRMQHIKLDWVNIDLLPSMNLSPQILREQILNDWKAKFKNETKYLRHN